MATARDRYQNHTYSESRDRGRAEHAEHDAADYTVVGTTCGECDAFTYTDADGNCEECGEFKCD